KAAAKPVAPSAKTKAELPAGESINAAPLPEASQTKPVIVGGKLVSLPPRPTPAAVVVEEVGDDIDLMAAAAADPQKVSVSAAPAAPAAPEPSPAGAEDLTNRWEYLKRKAAAQAIPPATTVGTARVTTPPPVQSPMVPPAPAPMAVSSRVAVSPEAVAYAPATAAPVPNTPWNRASIGSPTGPIPPAAASAPVNLGPFPPVLEENGISLDFSPERRQDDLISKLKMLAIEDGELRALLLQKNPSHLPALIEYVMLRPEPVRLAFVARELGHYHDPAVTDVLAQLLYHEDVRVVLAAIQGIQLNADPSGILHVSPFISSPDGILSEAARNALMSYGPAKVLQMYARELPRNADDRIREGGVFVLSRMKGGAVTNLLVQMLADRSVEVRKKVIMAMTFQKDPQYLPVLREFMKAAPEEEKKLARKAV
ncbi:MAG TPA: HEAT repeat domain-containing protein, partial [Candidatus Ozemobacteraceae bacterium]|nr:HEAT repeat domain-containing protein [Candidatus Ozemobacteraceae bacterium]